MSSPLPIACEASEYSRSAIRSRSSRAAFSATALAVPTVTKPNWWQTLKAKMAEWKDTVLDRATAAVQAVTLTARMLTAVLPWKRIALVTLGVGLAVGLTALLVDRFCPPALAAAVSGVGAAVTAAVAQLTGGLRKGGWLAAR